MASAAELKQDASLYFLALGAFAIGTEGFMLAGLLPITSKDLRIGLPAAGQLVTVFSLSYGISSPILTTLSAGVDRRRFLIAALLCFTVANFAACVFHARWAATPVEVAVQTAAPRAERSTLT